MSVFSNASSTSAAVLFAATRVFAVAVALAVFYDQLIAVDYPMQWLSRPFGLVLSALALSYLVTLVPHLSASSQRRWYTTWSLALAMVGAWVLGAVFAVSVTTALPARTILSDYPEVTAALVVTLLVALCFGFLASRQSAHASAPAGQ
ncbi:MULTISPECIES: hypothetical protein [Actinomyces]|uniref:Uncharacterized protein n=1 Tax=Actinomyces respiraculi TaxID=2744574 RepID=A0A7T0LM16_9ACTO|nr:MULTISPECIES: hypothetical protein [Actinomyces]QPL06241.1 hypothetical protein ID810_04880 [Actinomyces respiraculi]